MTNNNLCVISFCPQRKYLAHRVILLDYLCINNEYQCEETKERSIFLIDISYTRAEFMAST